MGISWRLSAVSISSQTATNRSIPWSWKAPQQPFPQRRAPLLVRADEAALSRVVHEGDLGRNGVHDLPDAGREVQHGVVGHVPGRPGLVGERLPDQPPADPERAQDVVERQLLLRPAPSGLPGGVVEVLGGPVGGAPADQLENAPEVVVAGAPQIVSRYHVDQLVTGILVADHGDQDVGQLVEPVQHVRGQ